MRHSNLPLMNLYERVLSVLSCQFVDEVLIDAPYVVTSSLVASLNITEVLHGTVSEHAHKKDRRLTSRYKYPIEAGIFNMLDSPSNFKVEKILQRIQKDRGTFELKFERKMKAENAYYEGKRVGSN